MLTACLLRGGIREAIICPSSKQEHKGGCATCCATCSLWLVSLRLACALMHLQALEKWQAEEDERQQALANVTGGNDTADKAEADQQFVAYVPLPDQKEIERKVMMKKKADLLAKYSSEATTQQQKDSDAFLGKR